MSPEPDYRFNAMADRRVGVRQWLSAAEAYKFLRDAQEPDTAATITYQKKSDFTWIPPAVEPEDPTRPTLIEGGVGNLVGVPPDTIPGSMTPEEVNALAPGVEVVDQHIVGEIKVTGTVPRVFRNCLLEGTTTPNEISQNPASGLWEVTTVNSVSYCVNSSESGTAVELYNCEVRHASKGLLVPGGAIVEDCYIHDCGADGVYANVMWADITVRDTIITRMANLRYVVTLGGTTPDIHADGVQVRGMLAGTTLLVERVEYIGYAANTTGGPTGDGWGSNNAFVLVQPGAHTLEDVFIRDCWAATDGNWTIRLTANSTFGQIKNFEVLRTQISRTSSSGPMVNHGGSESWVVADCVDENGADIDAIMQAGTGW